MGMASPKTGSGSWFANLCLRWSVWFGESGKGNYIFLIIYWIIRIEVFFFLYLQYLTVIIYAHAAIPKVNNKKLAMFNI